ncbi:MAG: hypothetical protein JXA94_06905 [Parachlamydiales bacterium]|nr:hypothetical protein [Parachlamydiales bacterium]
MKIKFYKKYFLIIFYIFFFPLKIFCNGIVEDILSKMTLDEKIGQLFMVPACPLRKDHHEKDLLDLFKKYHIGGVIIKQSDPESQINFLNFLQKNSEYPLLVSADAEWGLGMRMENVISYPKNLYLSKLDNSNYHLIYELGKEIARQLKLVGVHINLAPVVDVNNNINNPTVFERSFGSDPQLVAKLSCLYMQGMKTENVLCAAKHFPGYGDIEIDPHLDLPKAFHDLKRLKNVEFVPYKKLIENDVDLIMTAHIFLPKFSKNYPATMSKEITTDLLKNRLGFKGAVITDALNMKALTNHYSIEEIALLSHMAGNDILLYGDHISPKIDDILQRQIPRAFNAIKNAYINGSLQEEQLNKQVLKILKLKEKLNLFKNRSVKEFNDKKINSDAAILLKQKLEELISSN